MQDFWTAVEALGGGLAAIVLVVLAVISWRLFAEYDRAKDDRLTDAKDHAQELREMLEATHKVMTAFEQTTREALQELRRRQ